MSSTSQIAPIQPKSNKFLGNIFDVVSTNNQTTRIIGLRLRYWSLYIMQVGVMLVEFSQIFVIGFVLDGLTRLASGYNYWEFIWIAVLGISLGISQTLLSQLLAYREDRLAEETDTKLYSTGLTKVLNYNLQWQESNNAGNKVQILRDGSSSLARLLIMLPQIFILGVSVILTIVYLSWVNVWLFPLALATIIISLAIAILTQPTVRKLRKEATKLYEDISGKSFESLNNIHIVKSSSQANNILKPVSELLAAVLGYEKKIITLNSLRNLALNSIVLILGFIYLIYGGYLLAAGLATFALIYAGYRYLMKLSQEVGRFTRLTVELGLMEVIA